MDNPKWYRIVANGQETKTVYLADGIFHAIELHREYTDNRNTLSARLCDLREQDFCSLDIPQLAEISGRR